MGVYLNILANGCDMQFGILDTDNEMSVDFTDTDGVNHLLFINKDQAIQIIEHLQKEFKL